MFERSNSESDPSRLWLVWVVAFVLVSIVIPLAVYAYKVEPF